MATKHKKQPAPDPVEQGNPVLDLQLTRLELVHFRDLFSVVLPPEAKQTLSQALAFVEGRALEEARLWHKVSALCSATGLAVDAAAPDFIVVPTSAPPMGVFRLANDAEQAPPASTPVADVFNAAQEAK